MFMFQNIIVYCTYPSYYGTLHKFLNISPEERVAPQNPLDQAGIRDHAVVLRRLLKVAQEPVEP